MNEDLYDTGSAVVGLYRLYQLFEILWGISRTRWMHWGGGGGGLYLKLGENI